LRCVPVEGQFQNGLFGQKKAHCRALDKTKEVDKENGLVDQDGKK